MVNAMLYSCILIILLQFYNTLGASNKQTKNIAAYNDTGPKIINGTEASTNATQFQVSIRRRLNDGYFFGTGHICGGSLIAPNVVLSAAHCFVDQYGNFLPDEDFIVVMGNLDRFERNNNTLIFDIVKAIFDVEAPFNFSTYDKDIALLLLNDSVPVNHTEVKPILLNRKSMFTNTVCQVTGWGLTEEGYLSDVLMTVDVLYIRNDFCADYTNYGSLIGEGMLCAGYIQHGERDACGGDSGGPLACNRLLTGIVSWGIGCAEPRQPGVYTDVAYYAPWIDAKLEEYNITIPIYDGNAGGDGVSSFTSSSALIFILLLITISVG